MELPRRDEAFVPQRKITDYLLADTHQQGKPKANFFRRFGFSTAQPEQLAESLREHAQRNPVVRTEPTSHGMLYVIEGELSTPDGRSPLVRSVWIIDDENEAPRFVTAYPRRRPRP